MESYENVSAEGFNTKFADWQTSSTFNNYWSYSYVNNAAYYARVPAPFQPFMRRYVQNCGWWLDGWVPYFHNEMGGIFSTNLAGALVENLSGLIAGKKIYFKNAASDISSIKEAKQEGDVEINKSVLEIGKWANDDEVDLHGETFKAITYALGLGTSALRLSKRADGSYYVDAWRLDRFFPTMQGRKIISCSFLLNINVPFDRKTRGSEHEQEVCTLEEHRYFGDYTKANGEVIHNAAICKYEVHKMRGNILNGNYIMEGEGENLQWNELSPKTRKFLRENYGSYKIGEPILMPFDGTLGVFLMKATNGITSVPEMSWMGESIIHRIIPSLEEWDVAFSFSCNDIHLAKGRVLVPKGLSLGGQDAPYSALDRNLYELIDYTDPEKQKPIPVQFDLRPEQWALKKEQILKDIAVILGVSPNTIASFLADNSLKTATEVHSQDSATLRFISTKRSIIEKPLNALIDLVRKQMGLKDKVEVRWEYAGMDNPYTLAQTLSIGLEGGFISRKKAVQMFNKDDNEVQIALETQEIEKDMENQSFGDQEYPDDESMDYFSQLNAQLGQGDEKQKDGLAYDNKAVESTGNNN